MSSSASLSSPRASKRPCHSNRQPTNDTGTDTIGLWLCSLNLDHDTAHQYAAHLTSCGYGPLSVLIRGGIPDDDLCRHIGVSPPGHRRRIHTSLARLRAQAVDEGLLALPGHPASNADAAILRSCFQGSN
jgi:hypothetical protein